MAPQKSIATALRRHHHHKPFRVTSLSTRNSAWAMGDRPLALSENTPALSK
jgi:hypothetical protein